MSLFERFFGRLDDLDPQALVATEREGRQISFQLLFRNRLDLEAERLQKALRQLHPDLAAARVEMLTVEGERESPTGALGLVGWGHHVVKLFGMNAPIPDGVFDLCVTPAHYHQQLKEEAKQHQSHLLLYYAGNEGDPLEQYVALGVVATALARFDALLVMNEAARASFPAEALLPEESDSDLMQLLRTLPIPLLYGGFVKLEVEDRPGVWMRTYGNSLLNLPDLAMLATGHHEGSGIFDLFANMLAYLHDSGAKFAPGHTMQIGAETYLKLRPPEPGAEYFLESDGEMLVATRIGSKEINR
jgi:hypothetical protein